MNKAIKLFSNPVLLKEFRQRFRTVKTPIIITLYLLVMGAVTFVFLYNEVYKRGYFQLGSTESLYIVLSLLQLGLIALIAPGLTAGSISGEREKQTLHVLLTTQLSRTSIILNKLFSSVSFLFLLVLLTMPIYATVLIYGGVSPLQLLGTFGFFVLMILFAGAFGIFCSAWLKKTSLSMIVSYFVLAVFLVVPIFVAEVAPRFFWTAWQTYPNHPFLANNPYLNSIPVVSEGLSPFMMLLDMFDKKPINPMPMGLQAQVPMWISNPWPVFLTVLPILFITFLLLSIYLLHPVRPRPKWLKQFTHKAQE